MSSSFCRALACCLALLAAGLVTARRARAQTCHTPATLEGNGEHPYRPYLGAIFASYGSGDSEGNYQGLFAGFSYQHRYFGADLRIPMYWLKRPGLAREVGIGDMLVTASATVLRRRRDSIALGVELPVMIPTGDAERELGMGHPMIMPAVWFAFEEKPFALRAQAGYGRLFSQEPLEHSGHTHGQDVARTPIVNPMNRSEFEHALSMSLFVRRGTSVHVGWMGAVPIDDQAGVMRQILAVGAAAQVGPIESSFELQRPVAGDPFFLRLVLQLTGRF
jgi:hypothetical protein